MSFRYASLVEASPAFWFCRSAACRLSDWLSDSSWTSEPSIHRPTTATAARKNVWCESRTRLSTMPLLAEALRGRMRDREVMTADTRQCQYNIGPARRQWDTRPAGWESRSVGRLVARLPLCRESVPEALAGRPKSVLRADVAPPGEADHGEQQLARLPERLVGVGRRRQGTRPAGDCLGLAAGRLRVEADARGPLLHAGRPGQCGQRHRHAVDRGLRRAALPRSLLRLSPLPQPQHLRRVRHLLVAEHMGVPGHHLGGRRLRNAGGVEPAALLRDGRVHRYLEQHVAQLLHQLRVAKVAVDDLQQLVRLL